MSFKIHSKLNRIVEVSVNLSAMGTQIAKLTAQLKEDEKELDLLTVHYMQTETEYGGLIGEIIDNRSAIAGLLKKHDQEEFKKKVGQEEFKKKVGMKMNARALVKLYGRDLIGKTVSTPAMGEYPGGEAVVNNINDDENHEIVFYVLHPTWTDSEGENEMGIFNNEEVTL